MPRKEKYVEERILSRWDSISIPSLIEKLSASLALVPEAQRDQEIVEADEDGGLNIRYLRLETEVEMSEREAREAKYQAQREAQEREAYERLKAKFGD